LKKTVPAHTDRQKGKLVDQNQIATFKSGVTERRKVLCR
jgi:hypothetical protein